MTIWRHRRVPRVFALAPSHIRRRRARLPRDADHRPSPWLSSCAALAPWASSRARRTRPRRRRCALRPLAPPPSPPEPERLSKCAYPARPPDARLTAPRPAPLLRPQVAAVRRFGVTAAGRAGMGSPVPAHEPPTAPVRSAAPTPRRSIRARKETLRSEEGGPHPSHSCARVTIPPDRRRGSASNGEKTKTRTIDRRTPRVCLSSVPPPPVLTLTHSLPLPSPLSCPRRLSFTGTAATRTPSPRWIRCPNPSSAFARRRRCSSRGSACTSRCTRRRSRWISPRRSRSRIKPSRSTDSRRNWGDDSSVRKEGGGIF